MKNEQHNLETENKKLRFALESHLAWLRVQINYMGTKGSFEEAEANLFDRIEEFGVTVR